MANLIALGFEEKNKIGYWGPDPLASKQKRTRNVVQGRNIRP